MGVFKGRTARVCFVDDILGLSFNANIDELLILRGEKLISQSVVKLRMKTDFNKLW